MSDANADTGSNKLAPEGLPPAAHVVGGVRHATPTRSAHVAHPASHDAAAQPAAEKTAEGADAAANADQRVQGVAAELPTLSVKDAAEHPKAVASTFYPPTQYPVTHHHDHDTRGHMQTRGQQKQIQQPGGSHGR